ncbi:Helix-turn-helix domain-containing protein [Oceanobacillus limi]|uniref:Helix-turn-helix domain-containing protein n=1 Tax=Oceanobacillus limi TaxID=930131 RepID=A0A1I0GZH9_9BACI|nr:helix-turn-helix transcriptional regulator [Oceanobacillus limi]SET76682.1 Helix-turn-helix domain-containing protein [Oceanobacillus limi]
MEKIELNGQTLRKMRKRRGMSQDILADRLHMSRGNISKLEHDKLEIRGKDLMRWVQETNSLDMLVAMGAQIDLASATQMIVDFVPTAGFIFILGGLI